MKQYLQYLLFGLVLVGVFLIGLPFIVVYALRKFLKKINFNAEIKSFNKFDNIEFHLKDVSDLVKGVFLHIDRITIKKDPTAFRFVIILEKLKVKLEVARLAMLPLSKSNMSIDENLARNLLTLLEVFSEMDPKLLKKQGKDEKEKSPKKKQDFRIDQTSRDGFGQFFFKLIRKVVAATILRILRVQITTLKVKIVERDYHAQNKELKKSALKVKLDAIDVKFSYVKNGVLKIGTTVSGSTLMVNCPTQKHAKVIALGNMALNIKFPIGLDKFFDPKALRLSLTLSEINVNLNQATMAMLAKFTENILLMQTLIVQRQTHLMDTAKKTTVDDYISRKVISNAAIRHLWHDDSAIHLSSDTSREELPKSEPPNNPEKMKIQIGKIQMIFRDTLQDEFETPISLELLLTHLNVRMRSRMSSKFMQPFKVDTEQIVSLQQAQLKFFDEILASITNTNLKQASSQTNVSSCFDKITKTTTDVNLNAIRVDLHPDILRLTPLIGKAEALATELYSFKSYQSLLQYALLHRNVFLSSQRRIRRFVYTFPEVIEIISRFGQMKNPELLDKETHAQNTSLFGATKQTCTIKSVQLFVWDNHKRAHFTIGVHEPLIIAAKKAGKETLMSHQNLIIKKISMEVLFIKHKVLSVLSDLQYRQTESFQETSNILVKSSDVDADVDDLSLIGIGSLYSEYVREMKKWNIQEQISKTGLLKPKKAAKETNENDVPTAKNLSLSIGPIKMRLEFLETNSIVLKIARISKKKDAIDRIDYHDIGEIENTEVILSTAYLKETIGEQKVLNIKKISLAQYYSEDGPTTQLHKLEMTVHSPEVNLLYEFKSIGGFGQALSKTMNVIKDQFPPLPLKFKEEKEGEEKQEEDTDITNCLSFLKNSMGVKVRNLAFKLHDSSWNKFFVKHAKFIREFLAKNPEPDEQTIYRQSKIYQSLVYYLLHFEIESIDVAMNRPKCGESFEEIKKFITHCDPAYPNIPNNSYLKITGLDTSITISGVSLKVRDYIRDLIKITKIGINLEFILTYFKPNALLGEPGAVLPFKVYYDFNTTVDKPQFAGGINYMPAFQELNKWITDVSRIADVDDLSFTTAQRTSAGPSLGSFEELTRELHGPREPTPEPNEKKIKLKFWDTVRLYSAGTYRIQFQKKIKFRVMSHLYPFYDESLMLSVKDLSLIGTSDEVMAILRKALIRRKPKDELESHLLKIPQVELRLGLKWLCRGNAKDQYFYVKGGQLFSENKEAEDFIAQSLAIDFKLHIPRERDLAILGGKPKLGKISAMKRIVIDSPVTTIHYQSSFMNWALNLPQLRHDTLKLYKINPKEYDEEEPEPIGKSDTEVASTNADDDTESMEAVGAVVHSDFLELLKHTMNAQLNKLDKDTNIFKMISSVNVKAVMSNCRILCSNINNPYVRSEEKLTEQLESLGIPVNEGTPIDIFKKDDIVGVQTFIDSILFSCSLTPKNMEIDVNKLRRKMKVGQKIEQPSKVWKMMNGSGKISLIYATVFDGINLSSANPPEFQHTREKIFDLSLENPVHFSKFFELPYDPASVDVESSKLIANSLLDHREGLFTENVKLLINRAKSEILQDDKPPNPEVEEVKQLEEEELVFDSEGIFFKADAIEYEENKISNIEVSDKDVERVTILHYLTLKHSKFLVTQALKMILKNIFFTKEKEKPQRMSFKPKYKEKSFKKAKAEEPKSPVKNEDVMKKMSEAQGKIASKTAADDVAPLKKKIKYVFDVEVPQFNLTDESRETQLLLTSKKNCRIIFLDTALPYDYFHQDLKITLRFAFIDMHCLLYNPKIAPPQDPTPGQKIKWIEALPQPVEEEAKEASIGSQQSNGQVFYAEDFPKYDGSYTRVVYCDKATFEHTSFLLDECDVNFSQPILPLNVDFIRTSTGFMVPQLFGENIVETILKPEKSYDTKLYWNNEPRMTQFLVGVGQLKTFLSSEAYNLFKGSMEFLVELVRSGEVKKKDKDKDKQNHSEKIEQQALIEDAIRVGPKELNEYLLTKIEEQQNEEMHKKSKVEFIIKGAEVSLTEDDKPFLHLGVNNFSFTQVFFHNDSIKNDLLVKTIEIKNIDDSEKVLTKYVNPNDPKEEIPWMFILRNFSSQIPGITTPHRWEVFHYYEIRIPALVIQLTEDLYKKFYKFLFQVDDDDESPTEHEKKPSKLKMLIGHKDKDKGKEGDKPEEEHEKKHHHHGKHDKHDEIIEAPSFYRVIRIGDLRTQFSFKSKSRFKRLNNIKLTMEPYLKANVLATKKAMFDGFVDHVKKRALKLVFSILGQKFGFTQGNMEAGMPLVDIEIADKELKEKEKAAQKKK